ncbi:YlxQ family RNA-binding protein [Bacillus taeanensis]|uniref:YlxQ family RNA-binding protein n=1 Tax=Bacillus taeanensis TaxID=273032 RepID=A0A366Y0F8_9BACI|nr:YlxQ family RNA-binding protein [Bacillus taeanensis]RBW69884.1 YlxQ family RNA-binding protein [Bacillus taeanensis]
MTLDKSLQLLGLAARARKLITGEELVLKEVRNKKAKLVLLAGDASLNTKKKITDKCSYYHVPLVEVSDRYQLGHAVGKEQRVIIAVIDEGFAKKIIANFGQ